LKNQRKAKLEYRVGGDQQADHHRTRAEVQCEQGCHDAAAHVAALHGEGEQRDSVNRFQGGGFKMMRAAKNGTAG
jgi:hypothetical protein